MKTSFKKYKETGVATLIITIVVLLLVTIVLLFATKVGQFNQRMVSNEVHYKDTFELAESGMNGAIYTFNKEFRDSFTGNPNYGALRAFVDTRTDWSGIGTVGEKEVKVKITILCDNTESSCTAARRAEHLVFQFTSTARLKSDDEFVAKATVRRQFRMSPILAWDYQVLAPLMVNGPVTHLDFCIQANPLGGRIQPVPLPDGRLRQWPIPYNRDRRVHTQSQSAIAIWTANVRHQVNVIHLTRRTSYIPSDSDAVVDADNPIYQGKDDECEVLKGARSTVPHILREHYTTAPDRQKKFKLFFPNDNNNINNDFPKLFSYLFGVLDPTKDWGIIKIKAVRNNQAPKNCTELNQSSGEQLPLWWITGTCQINGQVGSIESPVILVIDDAKLEMKNIASKIYGIVYLFDNPDNTEQPSGEFEAGIVENGAGAKATIFGQLISDVGGDKLTGGIRIKYDYLKYLPPSDDIRIPYLDKLRGNDNKTNYSIEYVPDSWRDY